MNSRFFTVSLLIHLVLVLTLGGTVLFNKYVEPPDFTGGEGGSFVSSEPAAATPPEAQPEQTTTEFQVQTPSASSISTITTSAPSEASFTMPTIVAPSITPNATDIAPSAPSAPAAPSFNGMTKSDAVGIKGFTGGWAGKGGSGPGSSVRTREFEFTAYLAKYSGGDWGSSVQLAGDKIVGGSLPNLLYIMGKFSRDKIKAVPQPVPLDLSSDEIFAKKPPFILFTGHRDFVLTPKEVENLQKYIRLGGCIWGDSSLPGLRSRFDIAFRREMRRVVPDVDKDFEPLPANHAIYTKDVYFPGIRTVQPGMNYYKEPIYALKFYGEIAVLYTPNDYCDMWQFGLDDKWQFDTRRDEHNRMVAMNEFMWQRRETYFRNITPQSVRAAFEFGTNIVIHLITRWEDKLRTVPTSL